MRLFKVFFALSFGVLLFFFLAKFAIIAAFIAMVLTAISFLGRKVLGTYEYGNLPDHSASVSRVEAEPLFYPYREDSPVWQDAYRSIEIR